LAALSHLYQELACWKYWKQLNHMDSYAALSTEELDTGGELGPNQEPGFHRKTCQGEREWQLPGQMVRV
jgi:hypothetical protein